MRTKSSEEQMFVSEDGLQVRLICYDMLTLARLFIWRNGLRVLGFLLVG